MYIQMKSKLHTSKENIQRLRGTKEIMKICENDKERKGNQRNYENDKKRRGIRETMELTKQLCEQNKYWDQDI